jgi:SAM-dependent methyltransferase
MVTLNCGIMKQFLLSWPREKLMTQSPRFIVPAHIEDFYEAGYLAANKDVQEAVDKGTISSGFEHFIKEGRTQNRLTECREEAFNKRKEKKINHILTNLLIYSEQIGMHECGAINCLRPEYAAVAGIVDTEAVSSHLYDDVNLRFIQDHPNAWILDAGAGLSQIYYDNVVNFEIVPYKSTDVLGIAEKLPFKDGVFDHIVSNAVLEHVRNPMAAAQELYRVLKPGGSLYVAVPFLSPYHGYPHHYFNMTFQGLRSLFPPDLDDCHQYVPHFFAPLWSAQHFFHLWSLSLNDDAREQLLNTPVREFVNASVDDYAKSYNNQLSEERKSDLAYGSVLLGKKPL